MATPPPEVELAGGPKGRVIGLVLPNGECPAFDFLSGLAPREQARFRALLERLTQVGYLRAPDVMRRLEAEGTPPVHEIKVHSGAGYRLYVIHDHGRWVATHGRKKPKDRVVLAEVTRARNAYKEWGI